MTKGVQKKEVYIYEIIALNRNFVWMFKNKI